MAVEIKFCGLTQPADASFAASLGASYVGAIFAGGPRAITPERAAELFEAAGGTARRVGVFGADRPADVARAARAAALHVVQLHGDPTADYVARLREECDLTVWAVVRVASGSAEERIVELDGLADAIVLDAFAPERLGGTGKTFDWHRAAAWVRPRHASLVVAGGLTAQNVGEAIHTLAPDVVDVSSGVESAPGIKDHQRMRAFAEAVRQCTDRR
ncbi:MAG TPA: phosphoribosylanthranilate isomerase [Gemmatimonadaceae bacterium]|nr:phosphoribosylanthranilate isomerase [Gemmatimonadaceae bacterium]